MERRAGSAGQRHPLALTGGETRAALAEPRVDTVGQGRYERAQADRHARPFHLPIRGIPAPDPHVLGDRVAEQVGPLWNPRDLRPPLVEREVVQLDPADAHRARGRRLEAEQHAYQRRLAATARTDQSHHFAGAHAQRHFLERRLGAARVEDGEAIDLDLGDRHVGRLELHRGCVSSRVAHCLVRAPPRISDRVERARRSAARRVGRVPPRGRLLQQREHLLGRRHALGAGVVVGAQLAQRQIGLGREHQREQRAAQTQLAAHQSQADRHRHERHRDRREELEDQRGQEASPAASPIAVVAVALGDLADALPPGPWRVRTPSASARPATTSRKWPRQPLQGTQLAVHALPRRGPHQCHEQRDQRES